MKLNPKALGLSAGLLWALGILVINIISMQTGWWDQGISTLGQFYVGYDLTVQGTVIGVVYAFIDGFVSGWLLGWLYNKFA